jgi:hypothetical protein
MPISGGPSDALVYRTTAKMEDSAPGVPPGGGGIPPTPEEEGKEVEEEEKEVEEEEGLEVEVDDTEGVGNVVATELLMLTPLLLLLLLLMLPALLPVLVLLALPPSLAGFPGLTGPEW